MDKFNLNNHLTIKVDLPLEQDFISQYESLLDESLSSAATGRKEEFIAGRACAQKALIELGCSDPYIKRDDDRSPIWPDGFVGSISHSKESVFASISKSSTTLSIGIDAEKVLSHEKFKELQGHISTSEDRLLFNSVDLDNSIISSIIFSAKESLYKVIHPLVKVFFGFEHAYIKSITPTEESFIITLDSKIKELKSFNGDYQGYYKIYKNQVVTSISISK